MLKYFIIGADGREYGPITADQLRQWVAEHRANAQSKIRVDGSGQWKTLADLPEFASGLASQSAAVAPPLPLPTIIDSEAIARDIIARGYSIEIGRCLERAWNLVMANFWLTVGATFVVFLVSCVAGAIPFGGLLLNYVFWGGLDLMFLKLARGQKTEFGDAFAGFTIAFAPLMLFSLVGQLLTSVGFLLCLLPGVYLTVAWLMFSALLIIDKRLDFWPAMELSRKVITHHWWQAFGFLLVCVLIALAGLLVCGIGFFIALPVTTAAVVFAYEDIFGTKALPSDATLPPP